ncbi:MAG: RHS repeat-associated core domain-containing protein, partial [candidate division Zixibacteria bacterium]|nr:RHS repeat-associated core domain-containing protein [candidate division Zixibacteria bacterium]
GSNLARVKYMVKNPSDGTFMFINNTKVDADIDVEFIATTTTADLIFQRADATSTNLLFYLDNVKVEEIGESYRFSFNGMEQDDEVFGNGNHYSLSDYVYNPRINRRWRPDPLFVKYPSLSPYAYVANNPIYFIDPDGRKIVPGVLLDSEEKAFNTTIKVLRKNDIFNKVYGQVHGSEEYFSVNRTGGQDFAALQGEHGHFQQTRDGTFFDAGSYFNKHTIQFNQKTSAFSRQETVFEEVFHAGQYLFGKETGTNQSALAKEVEVRVARAFAAGDNQKEFGNESYVREFAGKEAVQTYFNKIKSRESITDDEQSAFRNEVKNLAKDTYGKGGYGKRSNINQKDLDSFEGDTPYFNSLTKEEK